MILAGMPAALNDDWISEHQEHSLCWMNHTVFDKKEKIGKKFKKCICYTCSKVAQQLLGEVDETLAPLVKKKKRSAKAKKKADMVTFGRY